MRAYVIVVVVALAGALLLGAIIAGCSKPASKAPPVSPMAPPMGKTPPAATPTEQKPAAASAETTYYTCTMHPEVHSDKPGKCPICGMDLVPAKAAKTPSTPPTAPTKGKPASAK